MFDAANMAFGHPVDVEGLAATNPASSRGPSLPTDTNCIASAITALVVASGPEKSSRRATTSPCPGSPASKPPGARCRATSSSRPPVPLTELFPPGLRRRSREPQRPSQVTGSNAERALCQRLFENLANQLRDALSTGCCPLGQCFTKRLLGTDGDCRTHVYRVLQIGRQIPQGPHHRRHPWCHAPGSRPDTVKPSSETFRVSQRSRLARAG